jgi:hypothetical protein
MLVVKKIPDSLIYAFAIIGLCAVVYAGWTMYERQVAQDETHRAFSAPVPSGMPDIFRNAPPPPQPHR